MNQSLGYRGGAFFGVDHSLAGFRDKRNREARDEDLLANMKVRNKLFAHIAEYGDEVTEPSLSLKVMVADVSMRIQKFLDTVTSAQSSVDNQQQPIFQPNQLDLSPLSERWNELVRAVNPYLTGPNNQLLTDSDSDQLKQMITTQLMAPVQKLKTDIAQRLQSLGLFGRLSSLVINADVLFGSGYNSIENQIEDKYYLPVRFGPQRGQIQMGVPGQAQGPQLEPGPGGFPIFRTGGPLQDAPGPDGPDYGMADEDILPSRKELAQQRRELPGTLMRRDKENKQLEKIYSLQNYIPGEIEAAQREAAIQQDLLDQEIQAAAKRREEIRAKVRKAFREIVDKAKRIKLEKQLQEYVQLTNNYEEQAQMYRDEIAELEAGQQAQIENEQRNFQAAQALKRQKENELYTMLGQKAQEMTALQRKIAEQAAEIERLQAQTTSPVSPYPASRSPAVPSPFVESNRVVPVSQLASEARPSPAQAAASPASSFGQRLKESASSIAQNFFGRRQQLQQQRPPYQPLQEEGEDQAEDLQAEAPPASAASAAPASAASPGIAKQNQEVFDSKPSNIKNFRQRLVAHASLFRNVPNIPSYMNARQILDVLTENQIALPSDFWSQPPGTDTNLRTLLTSPRADKRAVFEPQRYSPSRPSEGFGKSGGKKTDYRGPMDFGENKKVTGGKMNPKHKYIDLTALCKSQGYIGKGKRRLPKESYEGFNDDNNDLFNIPAPMQPKDERMKQELKHMPILMGNKGLPKIYGRERQLKNLGFYKPGPYREHRE